MPLIYYICNGYRITGSAEVQPANVITREKA